MSSDLARHAADYLKLRRALGHDLADAARLLPRFVTHLETVGASRITTDVALIWVRRPDADPSSSVWLRRMTVVRGFARYMSGIDPATEVPPLGLVTYRQPLGLCYDHVAQVLHVVAKGCYAFVESGETECGRPHVHTSAAGAEVHRCADDGDS